MAKPYLKKSSLLFIAIFPLTGHTQMLALADEDLALLYGDEESISIATGTTKPLHLAPSVASVVTAREIQSLGITTLDEALELVPGLHVSRSFNRLNPIYSIRGIHTSLNPQVLLLINGVPQEDMINSGRVESFRLPIASISRIEVIRGPGSALHGTDAFAGVINIITKDATELNGATAGGRTGSFGSHEGWVQYGGRQGSWGSAMSLEYVTTDGDKTRVINHDGLGNTGPVSTHYDLYNLNLELSRDNWNLWLNSWATWHAGVGPGIAQVLDPVGEQNTRLQNAKLGYHDTLGHHWGVESNLSYTRQTQMVRFQIFPPGTTLPICNDGGGNSGNIFVPWACSSFNNVTFSDGFWGMPGGTSDTSRFEAALLYHGFTHHNLRFAAGINHQSLHATEIKNFGPGVIDGNTTPIDSSYLTDVTGQAGIFIPDKNRTVRYIALQDEWQLARDWELTAGLRYDDYSNIGSTTNPRLALVWATDYNLSTKLLYGRAFRAPSMGELYFINNPITVGNPNLKPETIDTFELAFDYRPSQDIETQLNLFSYQVHRLIDYVNGEAKNVHNQDGHGLEFDMEWQASGRLTLNGNFAWQASENSDNGATIANAPTRQLGAGARWHVTQKLQLGSKASWIAGRERAAGDDRPAVADYTLIDVSLRYTPVTSAWQFALAARNLLDKDAREPSPYSLPAASIPNDFPLEGRNYYLEASYHFE